MISLYFENKIRVNISHVVIRHDLLKEIFSDKLFLN